MTRVFGGFPGRLNVVDVETSGLDPRRDRLISIGAIALVDGLVRFDESFRVVLRQPAPSHPENILVHGIGGTEQLSGVEPADGLAAWQRFAGRDPLVGFHADFDRIVLERAVRAALGVKPANVWLDMALIMPALFERRATTLDDWMRVFAVEAYARHDALADALATAELLQIALAEAARRDILTLRALKRLERQQRWLGRALRG